MDYPLTMWGIHTPTDVPIILFMTIIEGRAKRGGGFSDFYCCKPLTTRAYFSASACAWSFETDSAITWKRGRSASGSTSTHSLPRSILMPSIGLVRRSLYCSLRIRITLPLCSQGHVTCVLLIEYVGKSSTTSESRIWKV